jgi:hypothetical protein
LVAEHIRDHYTVFTNRRLTGGADEKLISSLLNLGVQSGYIVGDERIGLALEAYTSIRESLPNFDDQSPFIIEPGDLAEVIQAFHDYTQDDTPQLLTQLLILSAQKYKRKITLTAYRIIIIGR